MEWLWKLDADILLFLQEYARMPVLNEILQFYTNLGNAGLIAILTCAVLLILPKTRSVGLAAAVSLFIEFLIVNVLLKNAVARIRPYEVIEGLECITELATDYSVRAYRKLLCSCDCDVFKAAETLWSTSFVSGSLNGLFPALCGCALSDGCIGGIFDRRVGGSSGVSGNIPLEDESVFT